MLATCFPATDITLNDIRRIFMPDVLVVHVIYENWTLWIVDQKYLEVMKCVAGER